MSNLLRNREDCRCVRELLEDGAEGSAALSLAQQEHLAACAECQAAADDIAMSRILLRDMPVRATVPGPWFAPRVMAAISAKESELRRSLEAWAAVPRLAARLSWVSALALLLASTWLYESPKHVQNSGNDAQGAIESLFDAPQSAVPDDVLLTMEQGQ
jgi:predicted anti-sigma-YlaC factor YlaD